MAKCIYFGIKRGLKRMAAYLRCAQCLEVVTKWKGLLGLIERLFVGNLKLSFA
jgi:hypothetical protein